MHPTHLLYKKNLKSFARTLRTQATEAEWRLWMHLRGRQLLNVQFYRQKPIGPFIVDFFAPRARLVIELDGSQHFELAHLDRDKARDNYLNRLGLTVLRFDNGQVMRTLDGVLAVVYNALLVQLNISSESDIALVGSSSRSARRSPSAKNPPGRNGRPPLQRGQRGAKRMTSEEACPRRK